MVATVLINEHNGTSGAETQAAKQGGTIRFKNADNATVDTANRLIIPTSLREYSFEKYVRLEISVVPSVDIDTVRAYTDGASGWGTGVKGWYKTVGVYITPAVPSEAVDPPKPGGTTVDAVDLFTATSGSPIDMDDINTGPFSTTGDFGNYLVLVVEVETSATQGTLTAETLTFAYDET